MQGHVPYDLQMIVSLLKLNHVVIALLDLVFLYNIHMCNTW